LYHWPPCTVSRFFFAGLYHLWRAHDIDGNHRLEIIYEAAKRLGLFWRLTPWECAVGGFVSPLSPGRSSKRLREEDRAQGRDGNGLIDSGRTLVLLLSVIHNGDCKVMV
jgi:hypothetical protein